MDTRFGLRGAISLSASAVRFLRTGKDEVRLSVLSGETFQFVWRRILFFIAN